MLIIKDTIDISYDYPTVVTLGKFDGVHRGHMELVDRVLSYEKENWVEGMNPVSCVCCFQVSPIGLLTTEERRDILRKKGVQLLVEVPFVPELITMEPEQFVAKILVEGLGARHVVVGEDYRFGYQRRGDVRLLKTLGEDFGFTVETVSKVRDGGQDISSTRIREALMKGDMENVRNLLGYPYFVTGKVIHGRRLGRTIGFPTTNVIPDQGKLLPPCGVYTVRSEINGRSFNGITNIGTKPTVGGHFIGVETFLYKCSEDLYGETQKIELLHFQRPEVKFPSIEQLKKRIEEDRRDGEIYFENQ